MDEVERNIAVVRRLENAFNGRDYSDLSDDLGVEIQDVVSDGRHVGVRVRYTGTDTGGLFPGVPPTGRPFDIEGIDRSLVDRRSAYRPTCRVVSLDRQVPDARIYSTRQ